MPVLLPLLLLFIGIPALEIAAYIEIGGRIGALAAIVFTFLTAALGVALVRRQGLAAYAELQQAMREGRPPVKEMIAGALLLLAGALLLIPGFVTDAAGFLLLAPPLRRAMAGWIARRLTARAEVRYGYRARDTIIEGEIVGEDDTPAPRHLPGDDTTPWRRS